MFGEWLSLVEHLVRDQGVGGSNPLSPTIFIYFNLNSLDGTRRDRISPSSVRSIKLRADRSRCRTLQPFLCGIAHPLYLVVKLVDALIGMPHPEFPHSLGTLTVIPKVGVSEPPKYDRWRALRLREAFEPFARQEQLRCVLECAFGDFATKGKAELIDLAN